LEGPQGTGRMKDNKSMKGFADRGKERVQTNERQETQKNAGGLTHRMHTVGKDGGKFKLGGGENQGRNLRGSYC